MLKKLCNKLKNKINFNKIKIINYIRIYKIKFDNKKFGYLYIVLALFSIILSFLISNYIKIEYDDSLKDLFFNTGIALIGLSGIIFTLQIFNQETRNNYTNSVMEKILDIRFQHIIQYIYLIFVTIIFLFIPRLSSFVENVTIILPFFYLTIINIFIMLGIDLFVSTNLSNKYRLILIIEKRINYILNGIEKQYKDIEKYSKKTKTYNPPLHEYINKSNSIFSCYIQCINTILRSSINDPILFENGMDAYIKIIKNRLSKRKNTFNYVNIPFLNEVLPTSANDSFMEKYMLEYLNEYANIALENKNRDIMQIIQRTYHQILLLGKDNRYKNDKKLELTINVVFSYYLDVIKKIIKMNNDNMLFETVEIFKDLFIKNNTNFYDLIDYSFGDFISDSIDLSLKNKSLMNFRNIVELTVIPLNCILNSEDNYNYLIMQPIIEKIKNSVIKFTYQNNLVRRKDDARLYLQYIFNTAEPYSFYNCLVRYYNGNIDQEGNYIDYSDKVCEIFKQFVDFYTSKEIIECLKIMDNDNRFVTSFVDYKYTLSTFAKMLIKMMNFNKFNNGKLKSLLFIIFRSIEDAASRHKSNGMRISELDDFYNDCMIHEIIYEIKENKEIRTLYFDNYYNGLTVLYDNKIKNRKSINDYYEFINLVYEYCETDNYITKLLNWYFENVNCEITGIISEYKEIISFDFFGHNSITYENRKKIEKIIYERIKIEIKNSSDDDINKILEKYKLKKSNRENNIKLIIKHLKK